MLYGFKRLVSSGTSLTLGRCFRTTVGGSAGSDRRWSKRSQVLDSAFPAVVALSFLLEDGWRRDQVGGVGWWCCSLGTGDLSGCRSHVPDFHSGLLFGELCLSVFRIGLRHSLGSGFSPSSSCFRVCVARQVNLKPITSENLLLVMFAFLSWETEHILLSCMSVLVCSDGSGTSCSRAI